MRTASALSPSIIRKQNNADGILQAISQLNLPGGGTALYDAVYALSVLLQSAPAQSENWLIVLTDGADGSSHFSLGTLCTRIKQQMEEIQLIVIGVGNDV